MYIKKFWLSRDWLALDEQSESYSLEEPIRGYLWKPYVRMTEESEPKQPLGRLEQCLCGNADCRLWEMCTGEDQTPLPLESPVSESESSNYGSAFVAYKRQREEDEFYEEPEVKRTRYETPWICYPVEPVTPEPSVWTVPETIEWVYERPNIRGGKCIHVCDRYDVPHCKYWCVPPTDDEAEDEDEPNDKPHLDVDRVEYCARESSHFFPAIQATLLEL